jgi:hypothetical protein
MVGGLFSACVRAAYVYCVRPGILIASICHYTTRRIVAPERAIFCAAGRTFLSRVCSRRLHDVLPQRAYILVLAYWRALLFTCLTFRATTTVACYAPVLCVYSSTTLYYLPLFACVLYRCHRTASADVGRILDAVMVRYRSSSSCLFLRSVHSFLLHEDEEPYLYTFSIQPPRSATLLFFYLLL